jgi:dynein heavy chain
LLRERISKWKDLVPIVQHLRNGDLKERHWVKVEEILGAGLEQPAAAASVTVGHLLGMNVMEARDLIVSVSTEASQEAALEAMLKKVQDRWATAEFTVNQYKDYKVRSLISPLDTFRT